MKKRYKLNKSQLEAIRKLEQVSYFRVGKQTYRLSVYAKIYRLFGKNPKNRYSDTKEIEFVSLTEEVPYEGY